MGDGVSSGVSRFVAQPTEGMQPSTFTPVDAFTTGDKTEVNHSYYAAKDDSVLAGVWECAPCREEFDAYPVHEMMTILAGSVSVTMAGKEAQTFTKGDTFFIEKGTPCVWEITETLRKYYMIAA